VALPRGTRPPVLPRPARRGEVDDAPPHRRHFPDLGYFEQQVFADTKTEVLFGPYSMQELDNDRYVRVTPSRLPEAHLAFIDELFDASAGTLNTLRPVLAEKLFYNPDPQPIPLMMLAAAGNHYPAPDREDLQALLDRFAVIMPVRPIQSAAGFRAMLVGQFERRRRVAKQRPDDSRSPSSWPCRKRSTTSRRRTSTSTRPCSFGRRAPTRA
jgi:hypothetical protein